MPRILRNARITRRLGWSPLLDILNIIWGSFGLIGKPVITLMFGGSISLIAMNAHHDSDTHIAIPIVGFIEDIILLIVLASALPTIIAGIGLLPFAP